MIKGRGEGNLRKKLLSQYILWLVVGTPSPSEIELFLKLFNGFQWLANVRKNSILDVAWNLDLVFLELAKILEKGMWMKSFLHKTDGFRATALL